MTDGRKIIISTLLAILLCFVAAGIVSFFTGCKPSIPARTDYPGSLYPCYLADVCIRMPAYAQQNPVECSLSIQKCYRYTDYDKCRDATDPQKCLDFMGIRI